MLILQWEFRVYLKTNFLSRREFCVAIAYLPRIVECGLILFSQIGLGLGLAGVQATLTQRQRLVKVVLRGLFSPRLCWLPSASHLLCSLVGAAWRALRGARLRMHRLYSATSGKFLLLAICKPPEMKIQSKVESKWAS